MARRILWRLTGLVPMLFIISLLVFFISKAGPADPVKGALSQKMSPEQIEQIRQAYGLDRPAWQQYAGWLGDMVTDGGGISLSVRSPVSELVYPAFRNTLILGAAATLLTVVLGVAIGFASGLRHGRPTDRIAMLFVQIGSNLPIYWFGLIIIWLTAVRWQWLPAGGMHDLRGEGGFGDLLLHLIAPAFAASLVSMLIIARFVRAAVIESEQSDYIRTYRSQGFGRAAIVGRHIGRNVLPPIVNTTGLTVGSVITGVVFVETIFSWPGIGSVLLNAIAGSDYPVIQSGILLVAVTFVLVNLVTDIALDLLNPRLRHGGA
ncbi:peptide/nickel transport system permease protein [Actinocorallia herbida]|uniref:Peptide/nickel transport system permease protein n=1 Tax=Actinocorallia herbida TaxID=58109 RepID=A0A3N1CX47_9ACTN|nr:ABC transporter permease [Actinocorallia herbida]ROO85873.1 peptide/nickel transport system permease protein [Actinocorallia herbida]